MHVCWQLERMQMVPCLQHDVVNVYIVSRSSYQSKRNKWQRALSSCLFFSVSTMILVVAASCCSPIYTYSFEGSFFCILSLVNLSVIICAS